jgi:hypothetical protein
MLVFYFRQPHSAISKRPRHDLDGGIFVNLIQPSANAHVTTSMVARTCQCAEKTARGPPASARAIVFKRCVPRQQGGAVAEARSALRGSVSAASGSVVVLLFSLRSIFWAE